MPLHSLNFFSMPLCSVTGLWGIPLCHELENRTPMFFIFLHLHPSPIRSTSSWQFTLPCAGDQLRWHEPSLHLTDAFVTLTSPCRESTVTSHVREFRIKGSSGSRVVPYGPIIWATLSKNRIIWRLRDQDGKLRRQTCTPRQDNVFGLSTTDLHRWHVTLAVLVYI